MSKSILSLVGDYWDIAWREGSKIQYHDDELGSAQKVLNEIESRIKELEQKSAAFDSLKKHFERLKESEDLNAMAIGFGVCSVIEDFHKQAIEAEDE